MPAAVDDEQIEQFLAAASAQLTDRARPGIEQEAAAVLASALARSSPIDFEPSSVPVLDSLPSVETEGPGSLSAQFVAVAPHLPWVPTRRAADEGRHFGLALLDRTRDLGDLTLGIMYVGRGAQYPLHHHPPQELYLTIAGQAQWRHGGAEEFVPYGPGSLIYNHPDDLHSSIAGDSPLVALFLLWP